MEQENIEFTEHDCTGHAEAAVMAASSRLFYKAYLRECALYSTVVPCDMCAGVVYWGNVGMAVYAVPERRLLKLTGDHE
ncbi:deaminase [Paenibacillus filicis]|uniref:Deaminase n=1 Tax=Paenibacillus gyeongsangnamensis TaxID=3388067 RepID=A0ABT4QCR4_9BACL|nr:deaminase [Paenibacillus filicis]MCZ8514567.1 deaminase [Paenibacillus filicis]